jgi:glucokinase
MGEKTAIGIDLGGTNLRVAVVSANGKILEQAREKTPVVAGPESTAQLMAQMISGLQKKHPSLVGVGIGSPGPLSRKERKIFQTPNLPGFDGFPLGTRVEALCGLPVVLEHDAKCAAFGEKFFGQAKSVKNVVLLTFGTGIGGGIFVDDKMIYGKSDGACEVGHLTLYPEGILCPCGNRGCLERYVSALAIERRAKEETGKVWSNAEILAAFAAGDSWAQNFLNKISIDLSIGIASLVNIFEPNTVVLAGGLFTAGGGPIPELVSKNIVGRCFASSRKDLKVVASSLGGDAGVLGAAGRVFEEIKN